jgi:hypothetical protein
VKVAVIQEVAMLRSRYAFVALAVFAALSCGDLTGSGSTPVTVRFALAGTSASPLTVSGASAALSIDPLVVKGSNGTLTINEIAMVVSHIEFEQADDACEDQAAGGKSGKSADVKDEKDENDECDEFNMSPVLLHMTLPGGATTVATDHVPVGTWTELKFRVKNVDFDDDEEDDKDSAENTQLQNLLTTLRAEFPDWPRKASFVVKGSFLPTGGVIASNYTTFFNGEIKVKMPLNPPLVISSTGASREVVVELDPAAWFKLSDGKVLDLSAFDFGRTRQLLEFRADTKKGFVRVKTKD